jgi:serine/threonine protein kinase
MEAHVGDYILGEQLDSGAFGDVFIGYDKDIGTTVVIKMENVTGKHKALKWEKHLYDQMWRYLDQLKEEVGEHSFEAPIPRIHAYVRLRDYRALVMEKLNKSLCTHLRERGHHFSLKTVLMLGQVLFEHIKMIHHCGIVHRDIKPSNFVTDLSGKHIRTIDFGLSYEYIDSSTKKHIPQIRTQLFLGTERYASVNVHKGYNHSRRDDIISIMYVLVYFAQGYLPWQGLQTSRGKSHRREVYRCMRDKGRPKMLCKALPSCFKRTLRDALRLKFEEEPKYDQYIADFSNAMLNRNMTRDHRYDWVV